MSAKGKGGGFFFDMKKPELTLQEIIHSTEGSSLINSCGFGLNQCNCEHPCPLHEHFAPIRDALFKLVSTETIQSLAKKYSGRMNNFLKPC